MKPPPMLPKKLMCKWDWDKLPLAERDVTPHCMCWNICYKKHREKEERIDKARGFWQKLWAHLS